MGLFDNNNKENTRNLWAWNKDLKHNDLPKKITKQQKLDFSKKVDKKVDKHTSGTKNVLSINYKEITPDQIKILKQCKAVSSADELIQILNRANKTRFKNDILNPLLAQGFFQRTIADKPKSPKQKYRITGKFIKANKSRVY